METTHDQFGAQLAEHAPFLRRLARALVRDEHAADDLVSETFIAALTRPATRVASPRAWLATILRRRAMARYRRDDRFTGADADDGVTGPAVSPEGIALALERERLVLEAVERLEEPYRTTVYLRYREGLSGQAIAERTGAPLKTVRTRLHRGLERLRQDLGRQDLGGRGDGGGWFAIVAPLAGEDGAVKSAAAWNFKTVGVAWAALAGVLALCAVLAFPGDRTGQTATTAGVERVDAGTRGDDSGSEIESLASESGSRVAGAAGAAPLLTADEAELGSILIEITGGSPAERAGAPIQVASGDTSSLPMFPRTVFSDATGVARVSGLSPGTYLLNDVRGVESSAVIVTAGVEMHWTLDLSQSRRPEVELSVTVVDPDGKPVPDATIMGVSIFTRDAAYEVGETDANGRARVELNGLHWVLAGKEGRLRSRMFEVAELSTAGGEREVVLTLGTGSATLGGKVLDQDGQPVSGALVSVGDQGFYGGRGPGWLPPAMTTRTDSNGSFLFAESLEPGNQAMSVRADGCALWFDELQLTPGANSAVAQVGPGATLVGTLRDEEGAAVGRRWVEVFHGHVGPEDRSLRRSHRLRSGPGGEIEFAGLPVEQSTILFQLRQGSRRVVVDHITAEHGERVERDLVVPKGPVIDGMVVDKDGRPISGVRVAATQAMGLPFGWGTVTDSAGHFTLDQLELSGGPNELLGVVVREPGAFNRRLGSVEGVRPGQMGLVITAESPGPDASSFLTGQIEGDIPVGFELAFWKAGVDHGVQVSVDEDTGAFRCGPVRPGRFRISGNWEGLESTLLSRIDVGAHESIDLGRLRLDGGGTVVVRPDALADRLPQVSNDPSRIGLQARVDDEQVAKLRWSEELGAWTRSRGLEAREWTLVLRTSDGLTMEEVPFEVVEGQTSVVEAPLRSRW